MSAVRGQLEPQLCYRNVTNDICIVSLESSLQSRQLKALGWDENGTFARVGYDSDTVIQRYFT